MAVLDADRVLLAVNASMTDTLGYAADQMIGRRADAAWSHVLRGDRTIHVRVVVRADGRRVRGPGCRDLAVRSG